MIGVDQKEYEWPDCSFAKMICTVRGIILTKGQHGHFYTFWTMPIMIFGPVANFGDHSLIIWL